jgi:predicted Zn-dependent peptidase
MGLLDQILLQGDDSLLYQSLVKKEGMASSVTGGINALLGNMLNYKGPMLWLASFVHDADVADEDIVAAIDSAIESVRTAPVDAETLARAKVKWRSSFYNNASATFGFGRADLLASLALFDDNPDRINSFEAEIEKITPDLIQKTAREYLRSSNRTILVLEAGAGEDSSEVARND